MKKSEEVSKTGSYSKKTAPEKGKSQSTESKRVAGLYLVSTPIGNLGDITLRALSILKSADLIACEDTRNTRKLLTLLNLPSKSLVAYHEYNAEKMTSRIIEKIKEGNLVALVSDAGAPLISDPGYRLVQACVDADLPVTSLPGASAAITALQLSGLPCHRFLFEGFLPAKKNQRQRQIKALGDIPATLIFYESPQRVAETLQDLFDVLGERKAALARELTKMHEEVRRGSLSELAGFYHKEGAPKGEIVLIIAPKENEDKPDEEEIDKALLEELQKNSLKDAASLIAERFQLSKRFVYHRALALENKDEGKEGQKM